MKVLVLKELTKKIEDCFPFKDTPTVTWLNIDGLHETHAIEAARKRI